MLVLHPTPARFMQLAVCEITRSWSLWGGGAAVLEGVGWLCDCRRTDGNEAYRSFSARLIVFYSLRCEFCYWHKPTALFKMFALIMTEEAAWFLHFLCVTVVINWHLCTYERHTFVRNNTVGVMIWHAAFCYKNIKKQKVNLCPCLVSVDSNGVVPVHPELTASGPRL